MKTSKSLFIIILMGAGILASAVNALALCGCGQSDLAECRQCCRENCPDQVQACYTDCPKHC